VLDPDVGRIADDGVEAAGLDGRKRLGPVQSQGVCLDEIELDVFGVFAPRERVQQEQDLRLSDVGREQVRAVDVLFEEVDNRAIGRPVEPVGCLQQERAAATGRIADAVAPPDRFRDDVLDDGLRRVVDPV